MTEDTDLVPFLMDPTGPWELYTDLEVPHASGTRINISTNHQRSNIAVHHILRLSIRVEKLDETSSRKEGEKKKLFDIIIEVPLSLTHSRTAEGLTRLPDYWNLPEDSEESSPQEASSNANRSGTDSNANPSSQRSRSLIPMNTSQPPPTVSSMLGVPQISTRTPSESRFVRNTQDPVAAASTPAQLSRRWLALSANSNEPGNAANSSNGDGNEIGSGVTVDVRGEDWREHADTNAPPPSYQDTTNNNSRGRNPYNAGAAGPVTSWQVSEA